mgnify:CR=1 FL=1|tara:strand:- start:3401 stop:3808 length:408 start_codon:yes stop_codon:yes gene_type:complete
MNTNKKYTIILSAFTSANTYSQNLAATDALQDYLTNSLYLEVSPATGHYEGHNELSFVIHTDDTLTVQYLSLYACTHLKQECVLISYNGAARITLQSHEIGKHTETVIGSHFVPTDNGAEDYTRITGTGKYWSVI